MLAFDEVYPPVALSVWVWLPLALAVLVALLWWYPLSALVARLAGTARPEPVAVVDPTDLASRHLAEIDAIEFEHHSGRITVREAHLRLSASLRRFGGARTGLPVDTLTLDELRARRFDVLADTISTYYPIAFAPDEAAGLGTAAEDARKVVRAWS